MGRNFHPTKWKKNKAKGPVETRQRSVADLGEGPGGPALPYFGKKKNKKNNEKTQKEEKRAGQAIFSNQITQKNRAPP